jgi:hypothetical protein
MLFSSLQVGGSVAVPERLRETVTHILSPEADVLEQVIAELLQLRPGAGAAAPAPNGGDDPPDRHKRRDRPRSYAARRRSRERQSESGSSGAPRAARAAVFVTTTAERRYSTSSVDAFDRHCDISFDEAERTTAQMAPSCSLHLIWKIAAQSLSRNLLSFRSLPARKGWSAGMLANKD